MSDSAQQFHRRQAKYNTTKAVTNWLFFDKIKELNVKKEENIFKFEESNTIGKRHTSSKNNETQITENQNLSNERPNQRKHYHYYESKYSRKKETDKDNSNSKDIGLSSGSNNENNKRNKSADKNRDQTDEKEKYSVTTFKPYMPKISHDVKSKYSDNKLPLPAIKTTTYSKKNNNFISSILKNISQTEIPSSDKNQIKNKEPESKKVVESKQSKEQNSSNSNTDNKDEEKLVRRRRPNFPKFERRISDKNINRKKIEKKENKTDNNEKVGKTEKNNNKIADKKEQNEKNDNKEKKEKNVHFDKDVRGTKRRKSIDPGKSFKRKTTKEIREFAKTTYIKQCEALCTAGRGDDGLTKINQDSYVLERNINGVLNFNIFGVLDGHGDYGHFASQFVKRYIINRIKNHPLIKGVDNPQEIYKKLTENEYQVITNIYIDADLQITKEKFNCEMSGTTCVLVIQLEEHLICANTGDSRAILVYSESPNDNLALSKLYHLSYDFKPELPGEKKRIERCGGTVSQIIDEGDIPCGPFRVWIKGEEYPGLAMSRSIGDMDAKKVGVIPNPQIIEYTLSYQSKYMIICSDGIWDFITNEEAMKIANKYYLRNDALGLCHDLTNISTANWLKEDIVVDDITVVVAFF